MSDVRSKTGILALAAALALGATAANATPENAPPVRIGVIDTQITPGDRDGMDVTYRHYGPKEYPEGVERINRHKTHGDVVLDSIADARAKMGDARRYQVFVANPFAVTADGSLAISYKGLSQTVQWFKENDVKVVSTTFAARENAPGMAAFEKAAREAGLVVVASIGNEGMTSVPFPAAYPSTIAVDGYHYKRDGRAEDAFHQRTDVVFDGSTKESNHPDGLDRRDDRPYFSGAPDRRVSVAGSSFAAARASAFLAANMTPDGGLTEARALVASIYKTPGRPVELPAVVVRIAQTSADRPSPRIQRSEPLMIPASYASGASR